MENWPVDMGLGRLASLANNRSWWRSAVLYYNSHKDHDNDSH